MEYSLYSLLCRHGRLPVLTAISADKIQINEIIHRLIIIYVGRSKELRLLTNYLFDALCCVIHLIQDLLFGQIYHGWMCLGMVLYRTAHIVGTLHQILGLLRNVLTNQEKARYYVVFLQYIQYLVCNSKCRTIIKG